MKNGELSTARMSSLKTENLEKPDMIKERSWTSRMLSGERKK